MSNGESISAYEVSDGTGGVPATELLDEFGQPTLVTAVNRGYSAVVAAEGPHAPGVCPPVAFAPHLAAHLVAHPELAPKRMLSFEMVDYNPTGGSLPTHPVLIVTADHEMMLMSHRTSWSNGKKRFHFRAAHAGVGPNQRFAAGPYQARENVLDEAQMEELGPVLWRTTAEEYYNWLNHGQQGFPGHRMLLKRGDPPADYVRPLRAPPLPYGFPAYYVDRSYYTCNQARCDFALYQPSARQWHRASGAPSHAIHRAHAQLPIPFPQPKVDEPGPLPLSFRTVPEHGFLRSRLEHVFPTVFAVPAKDTDIQPLVHDIAWLIGLWLAKGEYYRAVICISNQSNIDASHMDIIDKVYRLSLTLIRLLTSTDSAWQPPAVDDKAALDLVAGEYSNEDCNTIYPTDHEHAGSFNAWRANLDQSKYLDANEPTFRQLRAVHYIQDYAPNGNPDWYLWPELFNNPDAITGSWFTAILSDLGILGVYGGESRKRVPMALLTDTVEVRMQLMAGYIDGDGCRMQQHNCSWYEIAAALDSKPVVDDLMHLSRGLGLGVSAPIIKNTRTLPGDTHVQKWTFNVRGVPNYHHPMGIPVSAQYKMSITGKEAEYDATSFSCQDDTITHIDRKIDPKQIPPRTRDLGMSHEWISITTAQGTMLTAESIVLHNCPWIGTCVGRGNYRFFLIFLTYLNFLSWFLQAVCIWYLWLKNNEQTDVSLKSTLTSAIPALTMVILCFAFVFMAFTMPLYVFHIYLTVTGQTTNEKLKNMFADTGSPFNEGLIRNVSRIFCAVQPASRFDEGLRMNELIDIEADNTEGQHPQSSNRYSSYNRNQRESSSSAGGDSREDSSNSSKDPHLDPEGFSFHPLAAAHRISGFEHKQRQRAISASMSAASFSAPSSSSSSPSSSDTVMTSAVPASALVVRVVDAGEMMRREKVYVEHRKMLGLAPAEVKPPPSAAGVALGRGLGIASRGRGDVMSAGQASNAVKRFAPVASSAAATAAGMAYGLHGPTITLPVTVSPAVVRPDEDRIKGVDTPADDPTRRIVYQQVENEVREVNGDEYVDDDDDDSHHSKHAQRESRSDDEVDVPAEDAERNHNGGNEDEEEEAIHFDHNSTPSTDNQAAQDEFTASARAAATVSTVVDASHSVAAPSASSTESIAEDKNSSPNRPAVVMHIPTATQ